MVQLSDLNVSWLTVTEVAERLEVSSNRVRRMLEESLLLAADGITGVPNAIAEEFLVPHKKKDGQQVLPGLGGTITALLDSGFTKAEALLWLLADHPELGASPVQTLRSGNKTGVRRLISLDAV